MSYIICRISIEGMSIYMFCALLFCDCSLHYQLRYWLFCLYISTKKLIASEKKLRYLKGVCGLPREFSWFVKESTWIDIKELFQSFPWSTWFIIYNVFSSNLSRKKGIENQKGVDSEISKNRRMWRQSVNTKEKNMLEMTSFG